MDAVEQPDRTPPLSRTAMHVLLAIGTEERHGYAIMREIERMTDGVTRLGPGGIYTTIRRLLGDALIEECDERPDPGVDDQRRRYYKLTAAGRKMLSAELERFQDALEAARRSNISIAVSKIALS